MQEFHHRLAYLHAYEHGVQSRSVGFVKAQERAGHCRMVIHLKGYCAADEPAGRAYIFFYYRNHGIGLSLGELETRNGALEWHGEWSAEHFRKKGIRFSETSGVWIRRSGGREYAAEWDNAPVDVSRFILYPSGGLKCLGCPRLNDCERGSQNASDRGRTLYEGSHPAGA